MLRPALLLPPKEAFDAPLGREDLSPRLGPATGRCGAYPDGTFTRWLETSFRTRHGRDCTPASIRLP